MLWLPRFGVRDRMLFGREREGEQLDAELRDHRVGQIDEYVAAGMRAQEAGYTALRAFGIPALFGEQTRVQWSRNWFDSRSGDLRYLFGTLRRAGIQGDCAGPGARARSGLRRRLRRT
jgi:hypothetical protein